MKTRERMRGARITEAANLEPGDLEGWRVGGLEGCDYPAQDLS